MAVSMSNLLQAPKMEQETYIALSYQWKPHRSGRTIATKFKGSPSGIEFEF
jgi:hypothetical protein